LGGSSLWRKAGWWVLPLMAGLTIAADQISKYLVVSRLGLYESWAPVPALARWFDIHYVTNTGAAFGLFQNGSLLLVLVAIAVSLVIVMYYHYLPSGQWLVRLSLGLQLGGALGNLVDRLRLGHVVDFLDVHVWPVFNLADSAIVCGVALLVLLLLREDRSGRQIAQTAGGSQSPGEQVRSE
jgi:signal peptidase II